MAHLLRDPQQIIRRPESRPYESPSTLPRAHPGDSHDAGPRSALRRSRFKTHPAGCGGAGQARPVRRACRSRSSAAPRLPARSSRSRNERAPNQSSRSRSGSDLEPADPSRNIDLCHTTRRGGTFESIHDRTDVKRPTPRQHLAPTFVRFQIKRCSGRTLLSEASLPAQASAVRSTKLPLRSNRQQVPIEHDLLDLQVGDASGRATFFDRGVDVYPRIALLARTLVASASHHHEGVAKYVRNRIDPHESFSTARILQRRSSMIEHERGALPRRTPAKAWNLGKSNPERSMKAMGSITSSRRDARAR